MNIVANYSEIIHTTNFLDKFLSNMTNTVSSIPSAANPYASENRARKSNALLPLKTVKHFQEEPRVCLQCEEAWMFPRT